MRQGAYDPAKEVDGRVAIARIDGPLTAKRVPAADINDFIERLPNWLDAAADWNKYVASIKAKGVNTIAPAGFSGGFAQQVYYDGFYSIGDDDALILEAKPPADCLYWGTLLTNASYMTVDWMRFHSSLNESQARLDTDGWYRAVVSLRDPGVPNWLDTGGNREGVVQHRWNRCSEAPSIKVIKVPLDKILDYLPRDTPRVTPDERAREIRTRYEAYQMRRRW